MSTTKNPLEQVVHILGASKAKIAEVLKGEEHNIILLIVSSGLDNLTNRLQHLSGVAVIQASKEEFPPITEFMGEKIVPVALVTADDLNTDDESVAVFVNKVNTLYAQFNTLAPEGILNAHTLPEDVLVLRGVAKKAGVENYEEAELNIFFIEKIQKAIKQKELNALEQDRVDADLQKQEKLTNLRPRIAELSQNIPSLKAVLVEAEKELEAAKPDKAKKTAAERVDAAKKEVEEAETAYNALVKELESLQA